MHNHLAGTLDRLERVRRERVDSQIHRTVAPVEVEAWTVPGHGEPVSVAHGTGRGVDPGRPALDRRPVGPGFRWGAPWETTWFRLRGTVPADAPEVLEVRVDLGWYPHSVGGHAEGLAFTAEGRAVKGIHPLHGHVRLRGPGAAEGLLAADGTFELHVEAAANPLLLGLPPFVRTPHGEKGVDAPHDDYTLRVVDLCAFSSEVWELARDLDVAGGLARGTSTEDARHWRLLLALERAMDVYDARDADASAARARAVLAPELALPARAGAHEVTAVGHAHMDSAWLWPLRETRRKLARTVCNALAVLDHDPDAVYTMTSAQHFAWLEEDYPDVFARVAERVREGRFVPVGGMWVETDGVLPTGESLVRQMVLGKRWFLDRFGLETEEVWLPDSFGYSGALPQLARLGGSRWFLTQKISWNDTTTFPHHTFWWEGLDGTRVLTHFPPSDTYAAEVTPAELLRSVSSFRDKAVASHSLLAFGYGDGGGGPTREMAARARRLADLDGAPKVHLRGPRDFFTAAEEELVALTERDPALAPVWCGELYLELHRGTSTSQAAVKRGNRRCEALLRTVELLAATAALHGAPYPYAALERVWQRVLLLQFHDILPGTSISWVNREANADHAALEAELRGLAATATDALVAAGVPVRDHARVLPGGRTVPVADAEAAVAAGSPVDARGRGATLVAGDLEAVVDAAGHVTSLRHRGRELVVPGEALGALQVARDEPVRWDAWDVDRAALRDLRTVDDVQELETTADGYRVVRRVGASTVELVGRLTPDGLDVVCHVDWQEEETLLKVALPLALRASRARTETQYGAVDRPLHVRTASDDAMFEVATHRYTHLEEPGYGVGVVNDAMHGTDVRAVPGGTRLRVSLLRSARFPDPGQDRSRHTFRWSVLPGHDLVRTLAAAEELGAPVLGRAPVLDGPVHVEPGDGAVVLDWVKQADDGSGDLVLRLYEPQGGRATARLRAAGALRGWVDVHETDLLERPLGAPDVDDRAGALLAADGGTADLRLRPSQVVTLRLTPARA